LATLKKYDMNPELMPRPESHTLNRHLKFALGLINASSKICIKHARHTFINWARNELGLPEGTIATIAGHSSIRTTEQSYLNRGLETVLKDLKRLNLAN
jgi:integrase